MATRIQGRVVRRPSLPLTERDERDLALLVSSEAHRHALAKMSAIEAATSELTEAALLHAVFEIGLAAIRDEVEETGYAQLAAQRAVDAEEHLKRTESRRRAPAWADES
jgi:hypothetical protein